LRPLEETQTAPLRPGRLSDTSAPLAIVAELVDALP
jgi:hypothetical protein